MIVALVSTGGGKSGYKSLRWNLLGRLRQRLLEKIEAFDVDKVI